MVIPALSQKEKQNSGFKEKTPYLKLESYLTHLAGMYNFFSKCPNATNSAYLLPQKSEV